MKTVRIVGLVACAMFALCAYAASSAFAVTQWLVNGETLAAAVASETEGKLKFINFESGTSGTVLIEFECEGIFDGTSGPGAKDTITDVLTVNELTVIGELAGTPLSCTVVKSQAGLADCDTGELASFFVDALNLANGDFWETELTLVGTTFLDVILGLNNLLEETGYDVECKTLSGFTLANLCGGVDQGATVENDLTTTPASVKSSFNITEPAERSNCSLTGEKTGALVSPVPSHTWAIGAELERLTTAVSDV